jgi:hypothetical protein
MSIMARVASVALLSVALLTGSASAECAWVLWDQTVLGVRAPVTTLLSSFGTMQACDQRVEELISKWRAEQQGSITVRGATVFVRSKDGSAAAETRYLCLPDTIDPRGPKSR